jgi:ribosomal-protein-alanine N-acetyltransferase
LSNQRLLAEISVPSAVVFRLVSRFFAHCFCYRIQFFVFGAAAVPIEDNGADKAAPSETSSFTVNRPMRPISPVWQRNRRLRTTVRWQERACAARRCRTRLTCVQSTVREYCAPDFDPVVAIEQLCFPPGLAYTPAELSELLGRWDTVALVAEASDRAPSGITGFIIATRERRTVGRIVAVSVVPEARRVGLAVRLIGECERRLAAAGCRQVLLEVAVDNAPAQRLYDRLGYVTLRTLPGFYRRHQLDAFQMGKRLPSDGAA